MPLTPTTKHNIQLPPKNKPIQQQQQTNIQDYEVGRLLGRGGFGFVYAARRKGQINGEEVAIKMVHPQRERKEGY